MGRVAFGLILIALVMTPSFRERARPYTDKALSPVYGWLTRSRVSEIARAIQAKRSSGSQLPTSSGLGAFLADHYRRDDAALDPWGHPFFLSSDQWSVRVTSSGPDGLPFTSDDIRSTPLDRDPPAERR